MPTCSCLLSRLGGLSTKLCSALVRINDWGIYLSCIDLNRMCATQGDSSSVTLAVAGQAACKGMQIQVPFDLPLTGYGKDGMISPEKIFILLL